MATVRDFYLESGVSDDLRLPRNFGSPDTIMGFNRQIPNYPISIFYDFLRNHCLRRGGSFFFRQSLVAISQDPLLFFF